MPRSIRDYTRSEKLKNLSASAERFYIRLLMRIDDYGNIIATPEILKAECFPNLSATRTTDIRQWMQDCINAELIACYSADEKNYIHVFDFGQKLRYPRRKHPASPFELKEKSSKKEKGREAEVEAEVETEERVKAALPPPEDFNEFRKKCIKYYQANLKRYNASLETQFSIAEDKILRDSKSQEAFNKNILSFFLKKIKPQIDKEFDKFYAHYSALEWKLKDSPIVDKFAQWNLWLLRIK